MKKIFFIATVATIFIYIGCDKADKSEPATTTNNTTNVAEEGQDSNSNSTAQISLRADCSESDCTCDCCCSLVLVGPSDGTPANINICGPETGCPDMDNCNYGGGCNVNFTNGTGGSVTLVIDGTPNSNDEKIFCSGGTGDLIQVTNLNAFTIRFVIECGGSPSGVITLLQGERAIITKATGCSINTPCIF